MSSVFQFELVSPEKLVISKPVAMVTVPGGEGEYGVLAGHAPMITTVKAGVLEIYDDENSMPSQRLFVSGGFAEVTPSRCAVLADEVMPVSELRRNDLEDQARALASEIAALPEQDRAAAAIVLQARQAIIDAKLAAIAA